MPKNPTITSTEDAFQAIGNMKVFYDMMERGDQDLVGMLDILDSDDPCISFFLESKHQEVLMHDAPEGVLTVRYWLEEELYVEQVAFGTIELFAKTIKDNIASEVLRKPQLMN